jgi:deazaflavin-dependent oxidoreductase (nitroreductase family)
MDANEHFEQDTHGAMTYPAKGTFNRWMFKTPLIWWRMGLGSLLGRTMMVLTTWGRKSHQPRHTMVSFTQLAGRIYIGAGWGERCDWYQNLQADPHVTIQLYAPSITGKNGVVALPALARRVVDEDEFRLIAQRLLETGGDTHFKPWLSSLGVAYDCEEMVAKRQRIHQLALDPQIIEPGSPVQRSDFPPAMPADLKWVWAIMAGSFCLGWLVGRGKR